MLELAGVLWAVFAPALLLLPGALVYLATRFAPGLGTRSARVGLAAILTVGPIWALWLHDTAEFDRRCAAAGPPQIFEKRRVDGFFLDDSTASSFGMRYLHEEGFGWIEARSIYRRDGFTRYERASGGIAATDVAQLSATIVVRSEHVTTDLARTTVVTITERTTGKLLARASSLHFGGGKAQPFLGAWGARSCPSGADEFQRFYHLAKLTLR